MVLKISKCEDNNTNSNNNHNKALNNRKNENENYRSNNNNNNNNNNNDLKDGHNDRLEEKETLTRTRNQSGIYAKKNYQQYTENNLKQLPEEKNIKSSGIYNTYYGSLSQKWIDERY